MKLPALVREHFFTNPLNSEDVFGGSVTNILRLACSTEGEVIPFLNHYDMSLPLPSRATRTVVVGAPNLVMIWKRNK